LFGSSEIKNNGDRTVSGSVQGRKGRRNGVTSRNKGTYEGVGEEFTLKKMGPSGGGQRWRGQRFYQY